MPQEETVKKKYSYKIDGVMPNRTIFISGILCWTILVGLLSTAGYSELLTLEKQLIQSHYEEFQFFPPPVEMQQRIEQHFFNVMNLGVLFWGAGLILLYFGHIYLHNQQAQVHETPNREEIVTANT